MDEVVATDPQVFADAGLGALLDYSTAQATDIAFGAVAADAEGTSTLSFTNSSTETDAILSVSASVEGVGFAVAPAKLSLTNGQSGNLVVTFSAADVGNVNGSYSGTLTIVTNDPNNKLMVIGLTATVTGGLSGAVADVNTQSISFPRTTVDSFSSRDLIVSNKGGLPLNITVSITGSDAFSLSDEGDFTLAGGESKTIEVVFAPATDSVFAATIDVHTDDATHPHFAITVAGTGIPAGGATPLIGADGQEIFGDFDGDASVTFDDFFQFADNFGKTSADVGFDEAFDLSGDGAVTFDDFFIFADNFGKSGTYASN
ncbi:MAG: choice-of-anchor D domain-containing protein [Candidatus Latescibacteria bacterium]|nr:choice-of-anchor D domain-containing protein [Candidatus Latescibacterota bacterium]